MVRFVGTVKPPSKGHFRISHIVLCREIILFLVVKNVLMLWERGPKRSVLFLESGPFSLYFHVLGWRDDGINGPGTVQG